MTSPSYRMGQRRRSTEMKHSNSILASHDSSKDWAAPPATSRSSSHRRQRMSTTPTPTASSSRYEQRDDEDEMERGMTPPLLDMQCEADEMPPRSRSFLEPVWSALASAPSFGANPPLTAATEHAPMGIMDCNVGLPPRRPRPSVIPPPTPQQQQQQRKHHYPATPVTTPAANSHNRHHHRHHHEEQEVEFVSISSYGSKPSLTAVDPSGTGQSTQRRRRRQANNPNDPMMTMMGHENCECEHEIQFFSGAHQRVAPILCPGDCQPKPPERRSRRHANAGPLREEPQTEAGDNTDWMLQWRRLQAMECRGTNVGSSITSQSRMDEYEYDEETYEDDDETGTLSRSLATSTVHGPIRDDDLFEQAWEVEGFDDETRETGMGDTSLAEEETANVDDNNDDHDDHDDGDDPSGGALQKTSSSKSSALKKTGEASVDRYERRVACFILFAALLVGGLVGFFHFGIHHHRPQWLRASSSSSPHHDDDNDDLNGESTLLFNDSSSVDNSGDTTTTNNMDDHHNTTFVVVYPPNSHNNNKNSSTSSTSTPTNHQSVLVHNNHNSTTNNNSCQDSTEHFHIDGFGMRQCWFLYNHPDYCDDSSLSWHCPRACGLCHHPTDDDHDDDTNTNDHTDNERSAPPMTATNSSSSSSNSSSTDTCQDTTQFFHVDGFGERQCWFLLHHPEYCAIASSSSSTSKTATETQHPLLSAHCPRTCGLCRDDDDGNSNNNNDNPDENNSDNETTATTTVTKTTP